MKLEVLFERIARLIWDRRQDIAAVDDPERSIEELKRLSGQGNSCGWRFNRDEIHSRQ